MKIKIGYEIECSYNAEDFSFNLGYYHNGRKISKYFKAETDGSLRNSGVFNREHTAEFVSKTLKSKKAFQKSLEEFKMIFKGNERELYSALYFNETTGTHFHFSIDGFKFHNKIPLKIFVKTRKYFFKQLKKLDIREELKKSILMDYFRNYAKKLTERNFLNMDRYKEWNFYSERENKGLEWRSFNLRGVETWDEFFKLMNLAFDTLMFLKKKIKKWKVEEKHSFKEFEEIDFEIKDEIFREEILNLTEEQLCAI